MTDNRTNELTAEQAIAEALNDMWGGETHDGSPWSPEGSEVSTIADKLRSHGLLSGGTPSEAQVEAAAKALHETRNPWFAAYGDWGAAGFEIKQAFRESARAALVAAQGAARPVNSFDTTAERVKTVADSLHVAPQEPNQTETKSGNNFVSLDPEKVADVERAAAARARGEALIEAVQAHRNLHKTYGSTSACRVGIGGQALTSHCGEICCNADAHQKEMEAWQKAVLAT